MTPFETNGVKIDIDHDLIHPQMREAFRDGTFERGETKLVKKLLKPEHRVIEVGTCTGYVALVVAGVVGAENVFCYEANPKAVELAKHHFTMNDMAIEVTNALLVPRAKQDFNNPTCEFPIAESLVSSGMFKRGSSQTATVPVLCLEDEISRRNANFLIIDIEGSEVDLIPSADLSSIRGIIIETHYRKAGEAKTNAMVRALYDKGLPVHLRHSSGECVYFYRG